MNLPDDSYHNRSDRELLDKYSHSRNNEWLGLLLERYLHLIFGVCMKYLGNEEEAKDHSQQICLDVIKYLSGNQVTYFKSWLYQVAKNHCLMHLRKNRHLHIQPLTEGDAMHIPSDAAADTSGEDVQLMHLHRAMSLLGEPQRHCLDLFFLQKKTYHDIAAMTGYTMKQVKSYLQNGKRNLRQIMERLAKEDRESLGKTGNLFNGNN